MAPTPAITKASEDQISAIVHSYPKICQNEHLLDLYAENDTLYHLNLNTKNDDFKKLFGKVNVVITGGSQSRIQSMSREIHEKLNSKVELHDFAAQAGRYSLFCVEHVLLFNHGMGSGSASIAFHEVLKLLEYAGVQRESIAFIRIGTCGGIGVTPGSLCLSEGVLTETLEENFPFVECGKVKPLPMKLDEKLRNELLSIANDKKLEALACKTLGTNDFYLGQGRLDGAFCSYSEEERFEFLQTLHAKGIRNIEMESHTFAAFCTRANVSGAVMCVALLNRLGKGRENDQVTASSATMKHWVDSAAGVLMELINRRVVAE